MPRQQSARFAQALQRILSRQDLDDGGANSYVVCLFVSRGSPNDAHAHAAVYSPHKRVQQKARESHARNQFALYVLQLLMYYNFCKIHKTLRVTPAMEAKVDDHVWTMEEVVMMTDTNN